MKKSDFINVLSGSIFFINIFFILGMMVFYFSFRDSFNSLFEFIALMNEGSLSLDPSAIDSVMFYLVLLFIFKGMIGVLGGVTLYLRFNFARLLVILYLISLAIYNVLLLSFKSISMANLMVKAQAVSVFSTGVSVLFSIVVISFIFWLISKLMSKEIKKEFV